jgi:hypothetical protein
VCVVKKVIALHTAHRVASGHVPANPPHYTYER